MIGYCKKPKREVLSEADCVFCKDVDLTCCRYWRDDEESHEILSKPDAYSLLAEVRAAYDELLEDAICLYQHYPNNFRKTADEYFKKEIEIQKKLSDHFS